MPRSGAAWRFLEKAYAEIWLSRSAACSGAWTSSRARQRQVALFMGGLSLLRRIARYRRRARTLYLTRLCDSVSGRQRPISGSVWTSSHHIDLSFAWNLIIPQSEAEP